MTTHEPTRKRLPLRRIGWGAVVMLLLLPLLAMQVTDEVQWTGSDFLTAALLLGATGGAIELAVRTIRSATARRLAVAAALLLLFVVWVELAAGW